MLNKEGKCLIIRQIYLLFSSKERNLNITDTIREMKAYLTLILSIPFNLIHISCDRLDSKENSSDAPVYIPDDEFLMELIDDNIDVNIMNPGHIELNQYSLNATTSSLEKETVQRGGGGEDKLMW